MIGAGQNNSYDLVTSNNSWTQAQAISLLESGTAVLECDIIGREIGTGNAVALKLRGLFRRDVSGTVLSLLGTVFDTVMSNKTLGAVLWDARLRLDSDDYIYVDVKGKSGGNVSWCLLGNMTAWIDA